jgi:hypothetical protein
VRDVCIARSRLAASVPYWVDHCVVLWVGSLSQASIDACRTLQLVSECCITNHALSPTQRTDMRILGVRCSEHKLVHAVVTAAYRCCFPAFS